MLALDRELRVATFEAKFGFHVVKNQFELFSELEILMHEVRNFFVGWLVVFVR